MARRSTGIACTGRAHQHRHLRPRDALDQVRVPEPGRDVRRLLRLGAQDGDRQLARGQTLAGQEVPVPARPAHAAGDSSAGREQRGAGPPAGRERDDRGRVAGRGREGVAEAADAGHVGPAEAVDGLVGVADRHQVAAVAGEQRQQRDLRRVGVLQLVHEDVRPGRALGREQPGLLHPEAHDRADQLSRVVARRVLQRGHPGVLPHEPRRSLPVVAALDPAEPVELLRGHAPLVRPHHHIAQLLREAAGGQGRVQPLRPVRGTSGQVALEQVADHEVLLRAREQARRRLAPQRRFPPKQPERVGVEGAGQRLLGGAAEPGGDAGAQLGRGPPAEGQHQHLLGVGAGLDPGHHRLDHGGGLAGARPGEHQQRTAPVVDDPPLGVVERRHRDRGGDRPDQAVRRRRADHVGHPTTTPGQITGSASGTFASGRRGPGRARWQRRSTP
jgi:hypothetical protein